MGYIFIAVCLSVCVSLLVNKFPAKRMHWFLLRFSPNGCFLHCLGPYWPWVKCQVYGDVISIFFPIYSITSPRNRGGLFSLQFVCVCVCVRLCLWTKFQSNGCTDLDAVFAKRLLSTLALGKLTKNYEEKMDFEPLWPWPLTQSHQFQ